MEQNEALELYRRTGAYLEGHFRLSSGLHSPGYMQSALVLQHPADAAALGMGIAVQREAFPAHGGVVAGAGRSHHRPRSGARARRARDFRRARGRNRADAAPRVHALAGDRVLVVEDVFTTGKSTRETMEVARELGAEVVGAASIVDRSGGTIDFGVPSFALVAARRADLRSRHMPAVRAGSSCGEARIATHVGTSEPSTCVISSSPSATTAPTFPAFSGSRMRGRCRPSSRRRSRPSRASTSRSTGAGRTDAGVHALGQVASFKLTSAIDERDLLSSAQREAARGRARAVGRSRRAPDFNARFSARSKMYRYRISNTRRDEPVPAAVRVARLARRSIWRR